MREMLVWTLSGKGQPYVLSRARNFQCCLYVLKTLKSLPSSTRLQKSRFFSTVLSANWLQQDSAVLISQSKMIEGRGSKLRPIFYNQHFFTSPEYFPGLIVVPLAQLRLRGARMRNTLFFYKNAKDLAEPEDVLILAHTFS